MLWSVSHLAQRLAGDRLETQAVSDGIRFGSAPLLYWLSNFSLIVCAFSLSSADAASESSTLNA